MYTINRNILQAKLLARVLGSSFSIFSSTSTFLTPQPQPKPNKIRMSTRAKRKRSDKNLLAVPSTKSASGIEHKIC
jgi:hypothetical protein